MDTLIKGGLVYTVATAPVRNGAIAINNGKIESVGPASDFSEGDFGEIINLPNQVLMPGFVNAHSHLQFSALRGKIPRGLGFVEWIRRLIPAQFATEEEDVLRGIRDGISEMLSTGTTAVGDISNDVRFARLVAASGLNAVCFAEVIAPRAQEAEKAFNDASARVAEMRGAGINTGLSPHAPFTVSEKLFGLLKSFAAENSLPVTIHVAESAEEEEFVRDGSGDLRLLLEERGYPQTGFGGHAKTPVQLLESYGALDGALAVHLNTADDEDWEILAKHGAVPVFCPGSSAWFGRKKVLPFDRLLKAGMRPAVGTDSLASNSSLSMLDELRIAAEYFPSIKREDMAEAATLNGALALGLNCGSIEKGKRADIISFMGGKTGDSLSAVFGAKKPEFVMINGKRVTGTKL
jgi:cytosine/adenosine deaminase-related metal-dependent hydrolase